MKLWGGRFEHGPSEVFERFSNSLGFDRRLIGADIRGSQAFARALERVGILTGGERAAIIEAFDRILEDSRDPAFFAGATDEDVHTLVIRKLKEKAGALADKIHTGRSRNEQVSLDTRLWLRETIDQVRPLGSGALAGSGFPFDREEIARDLGFDGITRNSMDVSADRDFALDFLHAGSLAMLHLSRLAEDWILYSSEEFGWLELGDEVTSGSSLMPQKKNPDSLELIRGKCGRVFGCYSALSMTMKGLPLTYNRDMQEDKEPLFEAADQLAGSLEMAAVVVRSAKLRPAKTAAAAEESWVVATDLAEALSRAGTPFHQAHQLVGKLVLESVRNNKLPSDWTPAALAAFAPEFTPEMARLLRPAEGMKTREIPGGTGPAAVAKALDEAAQRLAQMHP
jgi:argininosuccinate lyase